MLKIVKEGKHCKVELFQVNRLNTLFSDLVEHQLKELVEEQGNSVLFDLDGIKFIDTSGFNVLLEISELARVCGSEFQLCNVSDDVQELIILLGLEKRFSYCSCTRSEEKILMTLD